MILTKEQLEALGVEELVEHLARLGKLQGSEIEVPEDAEAGELVQLYLDSVVQPNLPGADAKKADVKKIKILNKAVRFEDGGSKTKAGKKYFELPGAEVVVGSGGIAKKTADSLVKDGFAEWVK